MIDTKMNLETFWREVNKRLQKLFEQGITNPAYIRLFLEKIMENDQDLYECPGNQDEFGRILLDNNPNIAVTNQEQNVALAMTNASKKTSTRLDSSIDPNLQNPPANPAEVNPNGNCEDNVSGEVELDNIDDDNDLYLNDG